MVEQMMKLSRWTAISDERGMTLVELLLAGSLSAVLMVALSVSSGVAVEFYSSSGDGQDLNLSHNLAMGRITKSIASASEVAIDSGTSLLCTFPDGGIVEYTWSGDAGSSAWFSRDGGDANPFVDGVVDLEFAANMTTGFEETLNVETGQIVSFDSFPNNSQEWQDCVLDSSNRHGLCFSYPSTDQVEKIVLTSVQVRIGRIEGQAEDLSVTLWEGFSEEDPRPWGSALATLVIDDSEIPDAVFPGGEMYIDWMSITLPEEFVIQANRFYCLMFSSADGNEAAYLRIASVTSGNGPDNGMAYIGTDDGGQSWEPSPGSGDYADKDVPVDLQGEVHTIVRTQIEYTESVDVDLSLSLGNKTATGCQRSTVRGSGER